MQKYKAQIKMIFFGFFNIVILYVFYQQSQVSNWAIYIHSRLSPTIYILGMLIFFSVDIFIAYLLIKKNHLSSNMKWFYVIIGTILGSIITLGVLLLWSSIGEFGVYPYWNNYPIPYRITELSNLRYFLRSLMYILITCEIAIKIDTRLKNRK